MGYNVYVLPTSFFELDFDFFSAVFILTVAFCCYEGTAGLGNWMDLPYSYCRVRFLDAVENTGFLGLREPLSLSNYFQIHVSVIEIWMS